MSSTSLGQGHGEPRITEILTLQQAAERLHCSRASINRLIRDGRIRSIHLPHVRGTRVYAEDLEALIKKHTERAPTKRDAS